MNAKPRMPIGIEVCILAGGLSTRMGRDKGRARLGRRTMLAGIRATVRRLELKVRTVRRDRVARCGPIGGIYTALTTSQAESILFVACDMPFVSVELLERVCTRLRRHETAVFTHEGGIAGFPFLLRRAECLPVVERQIKKGEFSLQSLARILRATKIRPFASSVKELANINTPEDLRRARERVRNLASRRKTAHPEGVSPKGKRDEKTPSPSPLPFMRQKRA